MDTTKVNFMSIVSGDIIFKWSQIVNQISMKEKRSARYENSKY